MQPRHPIGPAAPSSRPRPWQRLRDEAGEGVISTGIAVLVMALIGAAMFVAFSNIFDDASNRTADTVQGITDGD
jgi:hypothetical protein